MSNITDDPFEQLDSDMQSSTPAEAPQGAGMGCRKSLRDQALAVVPPERHSALLLAAADAKIGDADDPGWWLVAAAVNIESAAKSVSDSELVMNKTLAQLPGAIQKAAISAGDDLRGVIEQAGVKIGASAAKAVEITASAAASQLTKEASKAAEDIKSVVNELPIAIAQKRDNAVGEIAKQGAVAAVEAVKAAKYRGRFWAGFSFLLVLCVGAFLGILAGEQLHYIQPVGDVAYLKIVPGDRLGTRIPKRDKSLLEIYQER